MRIRLLAILFIAGSAFAQTELDGLWEAKLRYGPDVRGTLTIARDADGWRGEIAGRVAPVKIDGDALAMKLDGDGGELQARFDRTRAKIAGHWFAAGYASPVALTKVRDNLWRGEVVPLDQAMTFYLSVSGTAAFIRNPERNAGHWMKVASFERDGDTVRLLAADKRVLTQGTFRDGVITMPLRGGTYDFRRVEKGQPSDFHPRRHPSVPYVYRPPRPRDDGWPVASVDEVGISREAITKFIQMLIDTPIDKGNVIEMHGVLIARHGKLVVEEYFHGEHADKSHDTRSAAKSLTATLIGAAIQSGVPLSASSSVYEVMNGGKLPPDLEPRKRAMTLEHLLTMTSGFYCDDNDDKAPGREDSVWEQSAEPDFYRLTLDLPMESDPGTHPVYCSMVPHLAGGVLSRATAKSLPVLFHELIAVPMQIHRYHMNLTPTGAAYMGGGMRFLPRDFMKLAQMHMDGGTWKGRRIVAEEWVKRSTSPLVKIGRTHYGYLWWVADYPYKGRTVQTFQARGNGSQITIAVPELDLVIGLWGGNYSDVPVLVIPQSVYVPEWILPAVE